MLPIPHDLGVDNPFYIDSKILQVIVSGEELINRECPKRIAILNNDYQSTIDEIGKSIDLVYLIRLCQIKSLSCMKKLLLNP